MVVQGVFRDKSAIPRDQESGWDDEISAVVDSEQVGNGESKADGDRVTSEFPESIEDAVRVAAETHIPVARSPNPPGGDHS